MRYALTISTASGASRVVYITAPSAALACAAARKKGYARILGVKPA